MSVQVRAESIRKKLVRLLRIRLRALILIVTRVSEINTYQLLSYNYIPFDYYRLQLGT